MFSNNLYQPQVVVALSQFSNLLSSARSGTNTGTYRTVTKQQTSKKTRHVSAKTEKQTEEKKAHEKLNIDIQDLVALPSQINIEELSPHLRLIQQGGPNSHVSADTFFENRTGFPEAFLDKDVQEAAEKILKTEPFKKLLSTYSDNLYFQQTRGFKTKRSRIVQDYEGDQNKTFAEKLHGRIVNRQDSTKPESSEKLSEMLQKYERDPEVQTSVKIAFAEGYAAKTLKENPKKKTMHTLSTIFWYAFFGYMLYLISKNIYKSRAGIGGLGILKHGEYEIHPDDVHVTFDDVKGVDTAKDELMDVVQFLKDPEKYTSLGAKLPKGVLLVGPPGVGKTLLARAVAGEAGVAFFQCSGSGFDELFVGSGARRIRDLFEQAKAKGSCVIFIDEIDSVGAKRSSSEMHPYANQTVNQLLAEMDGFAQNESIIVLGATNRVDNLDKALRRPGRFDVEVRVFPPDLKGRKDILELYLSKIKADPKVDVEELAKGTGGFTGADIRNLVNQAALKAAMDSESCVTMNHMYWARDKVLMGPENKTKIPDEKTNWNTAYHEAGHTVVSYFTKDATPLHKVTIRTRGMALGHTSFIPDKEHYNETKAELLAQLDVAMGGRVAEEIIYGSENVTTGASSDFETATTIATAMVKKFGMSEKVGVRVFSNGAQDAGLIFAKINEVSPAVTEEVDNEIKRFLQESYDRAKHILKTYSREHKELAKMLMKYETLDKNEIKMIMEGKKFEKKVFS